jgi:hypothetical protein
VIYRIHKNHHRAWPPHLAIWHNKYAIRKLVSFGYGCNYDLHSEDQEDTNKLFGIGYLWNHHEESARFGWLFKDGKIQINAYLYIGGERSIDMLCMVPLNAKIEYHLMINPGYYTFKVKNPVNGIILAERDFHFSHKKKWSFPLGVYFGGNRTAPQKMDIEMKNI